MSLVAKIVPPSLLVPVGTEVKFFCNVHHDSQEIYSVRTYIGNNWTYHQRQQNETSLPLKFIATQDVSVSCYALTLAATSNSNIAELQVINSDGK